ncbi:MAG TPA: hypothetical protein VFA80_19570 [Xanthobacteraceae bacterium]|nr:hypothetical protein [Xanthobacteraceae bacterium]
MHLRSRRAESILCAAVLAVLVSGAPAAAQQRPQPNLNPEDQLAPSQIVQPMPAPVAEPDGSSAGGAKSAPNGQAPAKHGGANPRSGGPAAKPVRVGGGRTVVECSGPFAKDSGMLALAMAYDSRNMIFTHETVQGADVGVTVLFPKDPKRRLEVWWSNPNRTGTYLIDIAGKSTWTGPGGLRLGLTLEQLEKLNRKPFKVKGFDKDGVASVSGWDDGALAKLPGDCKAGVNLHAAAKGGATDAPEKDEYSSDDPALRALKPTVAEILIGY